MEAHVPVADPIDERELSHLIAATARAHHAAFATSNGVDPDWALWYAGHLQATLWDRLGTLPSRAELTYLLVGADRAYREAPEADRGKWPAYYARYLVEHVEHS
jgi:NAD(P)H-hydrate epimerase